MIPFEGDLPEINDHVHRIVATHKKPRKKVRL